MLKIFCMWLNTHGRYLQLMHINRNLCLFITLNEPWQINTLNVFFFLLFSLTLTYNKSCQQRSFDENFIIVQTLVFIKKTASRILLHLKDSNYCPLRVHFCLLCETCDNLHTMTRYLGFQSKIQDWSFYNAIFGFNNSLGCQ